MSAIFRRESLPSHRADGLRLLALELFRRQPVLARLGVALWAAIPPATLALLIDPRLFEGVSVWLKPIKFMAATGLFALTSAWFFGWLPESRRRALPARLIVWVTLAASLFEVGYITLQGALGEASHFNESDPFHAVMFQLMGLGAVLLTATALLLARELRRHGLQGLHPALRQAVLSGLWITGLLGIATGVAMGATGSHAVGGPPGGPGLPLFGWSTSLGDLRVAHFLAIHGEQLLPLAALLLVALAPRRAVAGVRVLGLLYLLLIGAALAQALAGLPLLAI